VFKKPGLFYLQKSPARRILTVVPQSEKAGRTSSHFLDGHSEEQPIISQEDATELALDRPLFSSSVQYPAMGVALYRWGVMAGGYWQQAELCTDWCNL